MQESLIKYLLEIKLYFLLESILQPLFLCPSGVAPLLLFVFYVTRRVVILISALPPSCPRCASQALVSSCLCWNILLEDQRVDARNHTSIFGR